MSSNKFTVHTSWPGLVLDVTEEEYMFYLVISTLHEKDYIDDCTFLTAERKMILEGYKFVA